MKTPNENGLDKIRGCDVKVTIRCIADHPVPLFHRSIYPGETREINWKQWALVQDMHSGDFELLGVVGDIVQADGGYIEVTAEEVETGELSEGIQLGGFVSEDALPLLKEVHVGEHWTLVDQPDPTDLTVAEIKKLELTPDQWAMLLIYEQHGKNRVTVIEHAERQIEQESDE